MSRFPVGALLLLLGAGVCAAQASAAPGGQSNASSAQKQSQNAGKNGKKQDKKKNKDEQNQGGNGSAVFSDEVAQSVLKDIGDGLEGHNSRLLLSAFDAEKMAGYRAFRDQIDAWFERYDEFHVRYSLRQTATEGSRGIVLADWEMEEVPADGITPALRRSGQIRLVVEQGAKGWKIVDFSPREMFS